jgi:hypothetical protein
MFSATSILSRPFSPSDGPDVPDFRDSRDAPHARDATDTSDAVGRYPGCRRSCRGCMMDAPRRVSNYRWTRATRPVSDLASAWCVCGNGKCKVCAVCARLCVVQAAQCTLMCGRLKLRARPSTPIKRRLCGELNASCFIPGVRVFYTASRRGTTKRRKSWHTHLGGGVCCFNRRSSRDWEIAARCRVVVDAAGRCCFRWMWI